MLLVITKVTDVRETGVHKKAVDFVKEAQKERVDESFYSRIRKFIGDLFVSLSINESLDVELEDLEIEQRQDGTKDLFGSIVLKYTVAAKEHIIRVYASQMHIFSALQSPVIDYSESDKERLLNARNRSAGKDTFVFIEHALTHYIDKTIQSPRRLIETAVLAPQIKEIVKTYPAHINRVFLLNKIESNDYKIYLLICYLSWAKERKKEKKTNPALSRNALSKIARFTSNILGSVKLSTPTL